jgi:deoxycytidine triphosphate deaminase
MTVIALTASGPAPSVVMSNDAFTREGTAILIQSGDLEQLGPDAKDCNASYDLRVGPKLRDHRSQDYEDLPASGQFRLLPGNAVIIQTEEFVKFPKSRFGHILPKVSLLQEGIANTPSKVDPGYEGHLLITAFNHGKRAVTLRRGQRFCSLHVLDVGEPVRPYDKPGKQISGVGRPSGWLRQVRDWIEANVGTAVYLQTIAIIGAFVVAILALLAKK